MNTITEQTIVADTERTAITDTESTAITESAVKEFERKLKEGEKAAATVEKYVAALRRLSEWLGGRELTKELLLEYRNHLLERLTAQTVNGALSAINSYLTFSGLQDMKMKFLRVQRKMFRSSERELTKAEYESLIATAKDTGKKRLALLMETICATGIRVSEVKYMTVEAANEGKADISLKGKVRMILIPNKLCRKLLKYAKKCGIKAGAIFITKNGVSMSRKQIWAEMKKICRKAGVAESKVFPHNLRHLFARCFYRDTKDVARLADVLGHTSIETTRIYLISTGTEHRETLERLQLVA